MSSAISLDKIIQAIKEIENCKVYDKPDMKPAKENWLGILYDARDRYESLEEQDILKINFVLCIHHLNYSQIMFRKEMAGAVGVIANTLKTIIHKKFISDSTNTLEPQASIQDAPQNIPGSDMENIINIDLEKSDDK